MSTKLGTLTLDLVAKIGSFVGPIKDAEKQTKFSFDNMRKHVNTYGVAVAGAAVGAATALAAMAVETSNQAVELERFAFRANTTTQEFQKMAVGAQAFGIEGDKLSDMMKDFNEKLGELTAIGAGGGVDFFEKIAVKTEGSAEAAEKLILKMQELSGPEALQLYVDKLEEAGVPQEQMSFYLESMASDMTDLIPLLANGGEGMRLYGDMAERAGIIMTDKTIESAKMLKDQVYMLDLQMQGAKNQLMQAVIPAFVDIAEAFFSGSEQGVQFSGVADGIADSLRYVAKVAIGAATAVQLVGKVVGGLVATGAAILSGNIGETQAIQDAMVDDLHETMMAAAAKFDIIDNRAASSKAEQLRGVRELQQANTKTSSGLSELAAKQNEAAKATKANTKANSELNRMLEEQQRIFYEYSTGDNQQKMDLESEILRLTKNGMTDFIPTAKARFDAEQRLIKMKFEFELAEHLMTEEQKLKFSNTIKQQEIITDTRLSKDQRAEKLKSLDEQYAIELQKARFHAQNMQQAMSDQIKNLSSGAEDINARASMSPQAYAEWSLSNNRSNAQADLKNQRVGVEQDIMTSDVYETDDDRYGALVEAHQAYRDGLAAIDVAYDQQVKDLAQSQSQEQLALWDGILSNGQNTFSQLTQSLKNSAGEQSTAYKTMFALQQGFSIASSLVAAYTAYTQAFADPSAMTLPQKFLGATAVMAALAPALATISSTSIDGMAHDGIDNIPREGTWLLDKGERVVDKRTNSDLKDFIAKGGSGGVTVNVNVPVGYTGRQTTDSQGNVTIDIVKQEITKAFNNIRNPNSPESRTFQEAYGIPPAR